MARGAAFLRKNWKEAGSSGRLRKAARSRYRLRSFLICCPELIGETRRKPLARRELDSIIPLKILE